MILKRAQLQGTWGVKLPSVALALYFFILFPVVRIFLRLHPWLFQHAHLIFMAVTILLLLGFKKINLLALGFCKQHLGNHLLAGGILGCAVLLALPTLDWLIALAGLSDHALFKGAEQAAANRDRLPLGMGALAVSVILTPLIQQTFFNGFVLQGLMRRTNPVLAVYAIALLFPLAQFKLSLGLFILGGITAFLFRATGTLYAGWIFQVCCALAALGIVHLYPKLITLVGFLF